MTIQEFYQSIGADGNSVIARFAGSEALARKFVLKFGEDNTFSQLEEAMKADDKESILRTAHTLKGVCGNLGLDCLTVPATNIVAMVRAQDYEGIPAEYEKACKAYELIQEKLAQLD